MRTLLTAALLAALALGLAGCGDSGPVETKDNPLLKRGVKPIPKKTGR